jgi:hypothetical protein
VIVASGDDILKITAYGADGVTYSPAAQILLESGGSPGADDMPGQIRLLVSADGGETLTEGFKLASTTVATFASDVVVTSGDLSLLATGKTIEIETGTAASACAGSVTANGATAVTVSTTCATTGSRIFLTRTSAPSGTAQCWWDTISNGVSFNLDCDGAETGTFNWLILHEAP